MKQPLPVVAGGLVLVVLDFRTESLDLLPDPLGWLLVALGASALALRLAEWRAGAAALLSASDAFLPYRYMAVDPRTGENIAQCPAGLQCPERVAFDPVSGWRLVAIAAAVIVGTSTLIALLRGLRRRAFAAGDRPSAIRLLLLTWVVLAAWAAPPAVALTWALRSEAGTYDPIWNGTAEYAALVGVVALGWVIVELCLRTGRGWAMPSGREQPSPWAELSARRSGRPGRS